MALIAYADSLGAMFFPVGLALPVLVALSKIRGEEIDFGYASGADHAHADHPRRAVRHAAIL